MVIHIDTSILIEFARTGSGHLAELLIEQGRGSIELAMSSIVVFEFFQGESLEKNGAEEQARLLMQHISIIPVTTECAEEAGRYLRRGILAKDQSPDALIAATAVCHHAQLATLNTRHFRHIPNLKLWRSKKMVINDSDWTKSYYV